MAPQDGDATTPKQFGSARPGRSRWLAFRLPAFGALAAVLVALCLFYTGRFHHFGTVNDLWFGADIWRHVAWVADPDEQGRWQIHPGAFLLFKGYGHLLRALGIEASQEELLWFSAPVTVLAPLGLVAAAARLGSGGGRWAGPWAVLAILVAVGPIVAFGPMPESHVLGGTALLLEAVLVLSVLRDEATGAGGRAIRGRVLGAASLAVLAAGFTVTNLMPAAILLLAVRGSRRAFLWTALAGALGGAALYTVHKLVQPVRLVSIASEAVWYELSLLTPLDPLQLWWSFQHLVLFQFGVPRTELITWTHFADGAVVTSIHSGSATPLQWAACTLWLAGIGLWAWRSRALERPHARLVAFCGAALLSLLAFHVPFSAWEAYIFSAHAWPYLVLPGVLAWRWGARERDRAVLACIAAAVALSLVQIAFGLWWLESLPGDTGSRPG